jgi:PAS domain S-box-containing protein
MPSFRDAPIRRKLTLVIMLTSSSALLLACAGFLLQELLTYRGALAQETSSVAAVIGANSTAALSFRDAEAARQSLAALAAEPHVEVACIYDTKGVVFAEFHAENRPPSAIPPLGADGALFANNHLTLFQPILLEGDRIGTVFVQSDLTELKSRLRRYALIALLLLVFSMLAAFLLSNKLQGVISTPILELAQTARAVSLGKNYSLRATSSSKDEVGQLIASFNQMLTQIQEQDQALRRANDELEQRVEERTRDLTREAQVRQRAQKESEEHAAFLNALIEATPLAIIVLDAEQRVRLCNPAFENLFQWRQAEIIGQNLDLLVADDAFSAEAAELTRRNQAGEIVHANTSRRRRDGSTVDVEIHGVPLQLDGRMAGGFGIYQDITDLKRAERELLRARDAAQEASRMKSEFLANMSHEIRTPMNGVIGMTELALETDLNAEQREYLDMVKLSANSLLMVINEILDFSKVESGKLELVTAEFSFRKMIAEAMEPLAVQASQKGLELAYYVASDVPDGLIGDALRLRQVVINLTGNAIKFTEHGEVVLRVTSDARHDHSVALHFAVTDTGIGIPAEKQQMIFEAFRQVDGSMSRKYEGTGLGLSISTRLVELMNGKMWVESEAGKGSTFHFTAMLEMQRETEARIQPLGVEELSGMQVLVVDDNVTNRRLLTQLLRDWKMRPTEVHRGAAALDALKNAASEGQPFSLALIDAQMPEMDGFELASKIKADPILASTVMVMLTSSTLRGDAERCRQLGVASYLTKPIRPSKLQEAILAVLGRKKMKTELPPMVTQSTVRKNARELRILVAEDNLVNQRLMTRLLEKAAHQVTTARNGIEAVEKLTHGLFDLVLMDVQMPEMDGFQATAAIRETEKATGKHIPIVAVTAHALKEDLERCLQAGMDDYISKPIQPAELFRALEQQLAAVDARGAAAHAANPGTLQLDRSEILVRLDGDENLLQELLKVAVVEVQHSLPAMCKALMERDLNTLQHAAHSLRGAMAIFGAAEAVDAAEQVEELTQKGNQNGLDTAVARLQQEMARLELALTALLRVEAR